MAASRNILQPRLRPSGWPVGSFNNYAEAQAAVDALSDRAFPVEELSIVGVDLMEVEKITGRLTWGRVLAGGAFGGAFWGLFMGLLLGLLGGPLWAPVIMGILMGAVFGLVFAAIGYGATGGQRDFSSQTQIIAGRYDVLCSANRATEARNIIASLNDPQVAVEDAPVTADTSEPEIAGEDSPVEK
ncbi:magnesium transporter [Corynebacterium breve]|uniref:Magnesium transporter n=1 Tax=Corynebacterium breve TaxID=3049799 RepID=A0ABY8VGF2_9CORY|nr:general stress protein [Corynebacterium breve]WIM68578.1 magnesium transporter [Corynebacterium breve]